MADRLGRAWRSGRFTAVIVLLALGAGAVDAFSFAVLGAVFASVMTGNLVLLGLAAVQAGPGPIVRPLAALAAYFTGVLATAVLAPLTPVSARRTPGRGAS